MRVRWKGKTDFLVLTHDKIYTVLGVKKGWYRSTIAEKIIYILRKILRLLRNECEKGEFENREKTYTVFFSNGWCGDNCRWCTNFIR